MPIPDPNKTKPPAPGAAPSNEGTASPSDTPSKSLKSAEMPKSLGRYRIVKKLGQGGMGAVYLAHDSQLDRQVALKVPHFGPEADKDLIERFYREARAAATLHHPNLCPIYDVGTHDGLHYLTMAYIEGQPLSGIVTPGKGLPPRQAAVVVRKLALALAEAHAKGIVHRDLKPANVMINQRKEPVIMDFGLARKTSNQEVRLTKSGAIVGTPAYMSPEQVGGKEVGPASDIFSLGVILYELLTGRLPFDGPMMAVLGQILTVDPEPPSKHRPDLDYRLDSICRKALAKDPGDRFGTMADLASALAQYLRGGDVSAPHSQLDVQSDPPAKRDTATPKPPRKTDQAPAWEEIASEPAAQKRRGQKPLPPKSWRLPWIVTGGAALVFVGGIVLAALFTTSNGEPSGESSSQAKGNADADKPANSDKADKHTSDKKHQGGAEKKAPMPGVGPDKIVLAGHAPQETWGVAFSQDGETLVSGGDDHKVRVWNLKTLKLEKVLERHNSLVTKVAYPARGNNFASVSFDNKVVLWDSFTLTVAREFDTKNGKNRAVAFSPDGKLLAFGGEGCQLWIWDQTKAAPADFHKGFGQGRIKSLTFSPDGKRLFITTNYPVLYYLTVGTKKIDSRAIQTGGDACAVSAKDNLLAIALGNGSIQFFDVGTVQATSSLPAHAQVDPNKPAATAVAFSPHGGVVASGGVDGTVRLWNALTGQELERADNVPGQVNHLAFSPDGASLAAALHNGEIWLWRAK